MIRIKPLKSDSWKAYSKLDECQTSMEINDDGTISFANVIRADTFRNSLVVFGVKILHNKLTE